MLKIIVLFILCIFNSKLFSQTIKGNVVDHATKHPIVGANVIFSNIDYNTQTDENGLFKIVNLKIGRYSINISSIGYENVTIHEILVGVGKETELTIEMNESFRQLNEVVVKAQKEYGTPQNEMATVSAKSISVEQTKRYAATWGDLARMALSFAGTSNVNDQTNEIVIRGNSPKGMLWKIDGVEVPNPSHFSTEGATGGGINALSINVLGNSDFYTGAFPAEYGNATSGVFDVHLRNGNGDRHETTVQAGFQGLEVGTEGPFSKKSKASYLFNYRYSTLGFFKETGIIPLSYDGVPKFHDLYGKIFIPFKKTTISAWALIGNSNFDFNNNTSQYSRIEQSNLFASGINMVSYINKNAYWENILSVSGNEVIGGYIYNSPNKDGSTETKNTQYRNIRFSTQYNHKINTKHNLRVGLIASNLSYNLLNKIVFENIPNFGQFENIKLNDKGSSQYFQSFIQWKYRVNPDLTLNAGFHNSYFVLNKKFTIEPRMGAKYQISPKSNLNFGFGVHSRLEPISIYLSLGAMKKDGGKFFPNQSLSIPKSVHYVIGYEVRPNKNWRINTELYLQQLSQIGVAIDNRDITQNFSLLNEIDVDLLNMPLLTSRGKGGNHGIELTVERFLTDGFYLLSTTSVFKGTYTNLEEKNYVARFSNNFVQNILAGKEWKIGKEKRSIFSLNLRTTCAGGVRVIPIDLEKSNQLGYEVRDYSSIYNQQQLANFFRTDFKINFIKNAKKITSTFSLDLNNVTNRANPKRIYYDYSTKSIAIYNQLGILPVFNYRLEF